MAIPRLSVKVGKKGKAQPHAAYIARLDKYAHRLESGEKLEATGYGNMPAWAADDPLSFWQAADLHERKNGSTYREHEIALPRELSESQRRDLLDDWIKTEIGDNYAYQYAIHNPTSADGLDNPHVHLMFSERRLDGIERGSDQFFKRYNSKAPERGGAKKDNTGKGHTERRENIKDLRHRWQELCNEHLERAGSDVRIDMQSYKDQGKDLIPEKKIGPKAWRDPKRKAEVMELREIKRELVEFVGDAKKFLQRLQTEKKETDRKKWLSPENIEKVWKATLLEAETLVSDHKKKLKANVDTADNNHTLCLRAEPQTPEGLFSGFKRGSYEKAHATWKAEEKRLRWLWIEARREKDDDRTNAFDVAEKGFEKRYPELSKERKRLQDEEAAAEAEKMKERVADYQEKQKADKARNRALNRSKQKSQGLGYGD